VSGQIETVDLIAGILRKTDEDKRPDTPEMTVRDLLHALTFLHWHGQCRYCHQPVINFGGEHGFTSDPWYHTEGSRSCRSASFDRDKTWDETLDRKWQATPHGNRDCPGCAAGNALGDSELYDRCHVCQVKTELLEGRAGHGWSWGCPVNST
jgi:hypothetical protein